jgi:hypothetical protein
MCGWRDQKPNLDQYKLATHEYLNDMARVGKLGSGDTEKIKKWPVNFQHLEI